MSGKMSITGIEDVLEFATLEELDALCELRLLRTFTKETTDLILLAYKRRSQR